MKINKAVFEAYLTCKYKAWRVANGDKGAIHAYTQQLDQLQKEHVSIAAKTLLNKTKSEATVTLPAFTSDVIAQRVGCKYSNEPYDIVIRQYYG